MKKLGFVLIMILTAFFLMGCPNPVKEVEEVDLPTEEEVLEMYKDWYISNSNEQANLRSSESESTEYTVEYFIETISKFSVNVKNCHLKYAKGENSLELWLENDKLIGHFIAPSASYNITIKFIVDDKGRVVDDLPLDDYIIAIGDLAEM